VLLIVSWRKPIAIGFALSAAVVLAVTSAWTYSQGLNPLSWLNYIRTVSHGDTGNVSPLLGGAWNAGYAVYPPELLTPIVIVIIASGLLWSWTKIRKTSRERSPYFDPIVFVGVTGGINMLLTFALLSRALDYEVFYVFPVLVVLLILSMHLSRVPCCIGAKRVVLMSLVFLAAISLGIRGLKLLEVYQSWSARNPEMISSFVKTNVPVDAIVFGEEACSIPVRLEVLVVGRADHARTSLAFRVCKRSASSPVGIGTRLFAMAARFCFANNISTK
jgi:hypothetical protein